MRRTNILILGGGPAGAAAAIGLAGAGRAPLLIERQRETGDALCGGFLSWHSLAVLERLGVKVRGATVERVRLFAGSGVAEAALPRAALGVSRRQLDTALLSEAERAGARVERGVHAREAHGSTIRFEGDQIAADHLLLATGKHDLRGLARPKPTPDPALGLRVRLGPALALERMVAGTIELHLFDRGYAGLVMQEDGTANLCLAVRKSRLSEAGGTGALLDAIGSERPELGERLAWMAPGADVDAIAAVPYGWRATQTQNGVFRLGDQAAVIPSLAGEGMGIALASGVMAAASVLRDDSAETYQRAFARRSIRPVWIARAVLAAAERPPTASMLVRMMRSAPGLAQLLARATRVGH